MVADMAPTPPLRVAGFSWILYLLPYINPKASKKMMFTIITIYKTSILSIFLFFLIFISLDMHYLRH